MKDIIETDARTVEIPEINFLISFFLFERR